jgi:hypothetical protein
LLLFRHQCRDSAVLSLALRRIIGWAGWVCFTKTFNSEPGTVNTFSNKGNRYLMCPILRKVRIGNPISNIIGVSTNIEVYVGVGI